MACLQDCFSEDSDFDDNLVVEGDKEIDLLLNLQTKSLTCLGKLPTFFDGFSDDNSDDGDNAGSTENDEMRMLLLMLDDEQLLTFDFTKSNTVSAVPAFVPTAEPGPTRDSPPGNGDAIDYFGMFHDDVFSSSLMNMIYNPGSSCRSSKSQTCVWITEAVDIGLICLKKKFCTMPPLCRTNEDLVKCPLAYSQF